MFVDRLFQEHSFSAPAPAPAPSTVNSVLENLRDYEINPNAKQEITKSIVKQQIEDFMSVYRHGDRVMPKWEGRINLHTIGLPQETLKSEMLSNALNQMSLITEVEIKHQRRLQISNKGYSSIPSAPNPYSNALMIFIDGKENLCLDEKIDNALRMLGKSPVDVYQRIEDNCNSEKQAAEYRSLRYDCEGNAAFFLYIVDISWVRDVAVDEIDEQKIYSSLFLQAAFRLFTLQDGVADTIKYSFMNHKYFWKSLQELAPVDIAFLKAMYCEKMAKKRRKEKSANYLAQMVWQDLK